MSRRPRHFDTGRVYHLISRFVDREWFIREEHERTLYMKLLGAALSSSDWRCIAFAIMSNHVHLATIAGMHTLDSWLRRVHAPFASTMNRSYNRIGPMFVRGPKAVPVDGEGVARVVAYIHNNPVRANLAATAKDSTWTSHRAYVGIEPTPGWLHVQEGLALTGFADPSSFDAWVRHPERREFDDDYERVLAAKEPTLPKMRVAVDPLRIVACVAWELGIPISRLRSRRRGAIETDGRAAVVYCAERLGICGVDVARALDVTQQAVSKMRWRDLRDEVVELGERVLARLVSAAPDISCASCV